MNSVPEDIFDFSVMIILKNCSRDTLLAYFSIATNFCNNQSQAEFETRLGSKHSKGIVKLICSFELVDLLGL